MNENDLLPAFHGPFLEPFVLGCLILGLAVAAIGYTVLGFSWHLSLVHKFYKRKRLRHQRTQQNK